MEYNLNELKKLTKEEYIKWYILEMQKLNPLASFGIDYSFKDAEFSYNQLHD